MTIDELVGGVRRFAGGLPRREREDLARALAGAALGEEDVGLMSTAAGAPVLRLSQARKSDPLALTEDEQQSLRERGLDPGRVARLSDDSTFADWKRLKGGVA